MAVCIPDKAADTSIFVADGKVDLPVRETDLEPGSVFFVDTERRHFVSERELGSKGRRVEVFLGEIPSCFPTEDALVTGACASTNRWRSK